MIIIANFIFYSLVVLWIIQVETVPDKPIPQFYTYTDALIKALCILLLIYSLKKFQKQVQ